jgi:hypothetical protein
MGGATVAAALAPTGRRILILERGERLTDGPEARDPGAIFARGHYRPDETWLTPEGERFNPGNYACVGGNTKFYGAVLMRYRAEDFAPRSAYGRREPGLATDLCRDRTVVPEGRGALPRARRPGTGPDRARTFRDLPVPPGARRAGDRGPASPAFGRRIAPRVRFRSASTSRRGWRGRGRPGTPSPIRPAPRWMPKASVWPRRCATRTWNCAPASRWSGWRWTMTGRVAALLTSAGRMMADQVVLAAGAVHTPVAPAALRDGGMSGRFGQPVGPGRAELHEPQLLGAAGAVGAAQPVGLPEDALSERLVFHGRPERGALGQRAASRARLRPDPRGADRACPRRSPTSSRPMPSTSTSCPRTCLIPKAA